MKKFEVLRLVAETLAAVERTDALEAPWRALGEAWPVVLEVATRHRVGAALGTALARLGLRAVVAEPMHETLEVLGILGRERNGVIADQARHVVAALNAAGVAPVLLKGTGHLFSGLYEDPADRLIGDLDVLVRREEFGAALAAMTAAGYAVQSEDLLYADGESRVDIHHAPMAHADWPLLLELHWAALPAPLDAALPVEALFAQAIDDGGMRAFTLDPEDALVLNILHAEVRHHATFSAGISLWQLYDSILLARRLDASGLASARRRVEAAGFGRHFAHHAEVLSALCGAANLPKDWRVTLGVIGAWRLRHREEGTRAGRMDAAWSAAAVGFAEEWTNVSRQWRETGRRSELLKKAFRPSSLARRARNVWARLRGN